MDLENIKISTIEELIIKLNKISQKMGFIIQFNFMVNRIIFILIKYYLY